MAPPAKRRRRNVVESDDEDDEQPKTNTLTNFLLSSPSKSDSRGASISPSPTKPKPRVAHNTRAVATPAVLQSRNGPSNKGTKSPSTSPEKFKGKQQKRVKVEEKGRNGDLMTLFSKQASKTSARPTTVSRTLPFDDIVSDPISEEDDVAEQKASTSSIVGQNARKRFRDSTPVSSSTTVGSSQKFLKPPRPMKPAALDDDLRPWSERFGPLNLEELAVHKRKVADVRKWLEDVVCGRLRQRLLLLKGAAGSGKTTAMRLLAKDMGYELLEWRNPTNTLGAHLGYTSASAQFQEFLSRGGKFGQLDTDMPSEEAPRPANEKSNSAGKIILIEEFPNTFSRSSTALSSFRSTLLEYLAANTPLLTTFGRRSPSEPITPVVLIVSETLLTTTSASADSFTAHRLLGPEILRHPGTRVIEFNTIAPTLLAKALELVVLKEARKSGRKRTPGPQVLKRLGEIGDIRSAISSLEFMCLKGDEDADWGAKVALSKQSKGAKAGISLTKGEEETLELISQREASLGIFHAVGKVVYNKREETPSTPNTAERLPSYIAHLSRPKPSEVSVDTLMDETGTDTPTFISALHENYMLSCETVPPFDASTPLDYVNGCIEYLSESDLLLPSRDSFFGGRGSSASFGKDSGSHVLRQDEIAFQVAVRGMLFSLPSPVKRKASTGAKGADAYKMFYPTSIKLWRTKEEFEALVDVWSTKLMKGEETAPRKSLTEGASAFRRPKQTEAGNWVANHQSRLKLANENAKADSHVAPLLSLGSAARREMLLERLPYMASIVRGRKSTLHSFKLRDIEKVVSFQGIGTQTGDDDEQAEDAPEDGVMTGDAWATDKPSEEASPRKRSSAIRRAGDGSVAGLRVQNLVISDDDIEDD
ncbi:Rad17 cell cycle checkpoint protein [Colletotrichum sublineola]|uniref:Putative Rad17 cell cycle checkpoint protein n=1 Tax=Colletotrichum sublineola TaxID=1173701 RepID=A0A066X0C8_COLSU|nr:Rad17 cell cycle checkpoint protein [Colletotrichum sublineola]KDN62417.1 putative Rad17 cell cycle checkpoint protein [Colletotrichum sublineola]